MKVDPTLRIVEILRLMLPRFSANRWDGIAAWPPDVYAVAGYLLYVTGLYRKAISNDWWHKTEAAHPATLVSIGKKWRTAAAKGRTAPEKVLRCWRKLYTGRSRNQKQLGRIENDRRLVKALFDLVAMADEACEGMGRPHPDYEPDEPEYLLLERADKLLNLGTIQGYASSLCEEVDAEVVRVLPKMRTPQVGLTFRSLTHHLALCPKDEITPVWNQIHSPQTEADGSRFNLLLVPSPYQISANQFAPAPSSRAGRHRMPKEYRSFDFAVEKRTAWLQNDLREIIASAVSKTSGNGIQGVIFPELSLASLTEFAAAYSSVHAACPSGFLVAGVSEPKTDGAEGTRNCAYFAIPQGDKHVLCIQAKHHKWCITPSQVHAYDLAAALESGKTWWENIEVEKRSLNFFALKQWLTLSFVICEDLARQEPASWLLRAVGPNLVLALLMDGEQVISRWPARYATVLAEDPGSSVLTITSRGMAARAAQVYYKKSMPRHTIAMWRDSEKTQPIVMEERSSGILLSLSKKDVFEFSTDGREARVKALVINDPSKDIMQISLPKKRLARKR